MLLYNKYFVFQNGRFTIRFDGWHVWSSILDHGNFHRNSIFHGYASSRGQCDILIVLKLRKNSASRYSYINSGFKKKIGSEECTVYLS